MWHPDSLRSSFLTIRELYLRWLDRYDRRPGEEAPVGLILCAGKSAGHVELLELHRIRPG